MAEYQDAWTLEVVDKASKALGSIDQSATKANTAVDSVGESSRRTGKGLDLLKKSALAGAAAFTALAVGAKKAYDLAQDVANVGDEAAKTARRINSTAEAVQELGYAAGLSGTNIEVVEKTLLKLSEGASRGHEAFETLGVAVKDSDGNLRSSDDLLNDVADSLNGLENDTQKAALTLQLMGEDGIKMASLLASGSDGIREMRKEARELGIVMSDEAAANAELFNDNLARLEARFTAISQTVGVTLIPVLSELFVQLGGVADEMGDTASVADTTRAAIDGILETVESLSPAVTVLATSVGVLKDGFGVLDIIGSTLALTVGYIAEGYYQLDAAIDGGKEARDRLETHQKRLAALTSETRGKIDEWGDATIAGVESGEKWRGKINEITGELKKANSELQKFASFQERARERARAAREEAQFLTFGPEIPEGFEPPKDKPDPKTKKPSRPSEEDDLGEIIERAQKEAEAEARIVELTERRELLAQLRLQSMRTASELQQIELERTTQLAELQMQVVDGEVTRTEAVLRREEIERAAIESRRDLERQAAAEVAKQDADRLAAMKAIQEQSRAATMQGISDAKALGGSLVSAFEGAQAPAALLDVLRGGFMAAEAVGLAAINPVGAVQAGVGAALHFANAAKFGAGGAASGAASASASASAAYGPAQQKKVAVEAYVEAFKEVNQGGTNQQIVNNYSGNFFGRDQATARDIAAIVGQNDRMTLGGN